LLIAKTLFTSVYQACAQDTAFTYQGRLNDGAISAIGSYDLRFTIYDALNSGNAISPTLTNSVPVTNGLFTTTLDFGTNVFTGANRWLDIAVRTNGASGFISLSPRQQITSTPYAVWASDAGSAASYIGSITDSQLSGNIPRLNGSNEFSGMVQFNNPNNTFSGSFNGNSTTASTAGSVSGQQVVDITNVDYSVWSNLKTAITNSSLDRFAWQKTLSTLKQGRRLWIEFDGTGLVQMGLFEQIKLNLWQTHPIVGYSGDGGGYPLLWYGVGGSAVLQQKDSNWYSNYGHITGTGGYMEYKGTSVDKFNAFEVDYVMLPGGCTFLIEQSTNSDSSWTTVPGFDALNGNATIPTGAFVRWTNNFPISSFRARSISTGQVAIVNGIVWNTEVTNGILWGQQAQGGSHPSTILAPPPTVLDPIYRAWSQLADGTLVLWNSPDNPAFATNYPGYLDLAWFYKTNLPNADVVFAGNYPQSISDQAQAGDVYVRDVARQFGYGYFDGYTPFGSYSNFVALGLSSGDGIHASALGFITYGNFFYDWLGLDEAGLILTDGSGLTGLNASGLSSGTVPDMRLSTNVALLDANQKFIGTNTFNNATGSFSGNFFGNSTGSFFGNGAGLTNLDAITGGLTTNIVVGTNTLCFTNGILRLVR